MCRAIVVADQLSRSVPLCGTFLRFVDVKAATNFQHRRYGCVGHGDVAIATVLEERDDEVAQLLVTGV
jgi:hypothetical protein